MYQTKIIVQSRGGEAARSALEASKEKTRCMTIHMEAKTALRRFYRNYKNRENRSAFGIKFNFQILTNKNKKPSGFSNSSIDFYSKFNF
jgi:hypothetical protein